MPIELLECVAIVDGASNGAFLAPAFRAHGVKCVHVASSPHLPARLRAQVLAHDYAELVVHQAVLEDTLALLRPHRVGLVLNGQDSGLELADQLSERLGLPFRNPVASTAARRDKYAMCEALRRAGLAAPEQFMSRDAQAVLDWVASRNTLPVVVKPARSAGVTGVKVCRDLGQVRAATQDILGGKSYFNEPNDAIVVQSFTEGQEYIVDAVSMHGKHKVINLWQVDRDRIHAPRLDKMIVVHHHDPRFAHLLAYARNVLDALGLCFGPSHLALFDTASGPVIVELNARLHGSLDPKMTNAVTGKNQVSATVEAYLNPARFLRSLDEEDQFDGYCAHVLLRSPLAGVLARDFPWEQVEALDAFVSAKKWALAGQPIDITTDLFTALGAVGLWHSDFAALVEDWQRLRALETRFFASPGVMREAAHTAA
jgi:biotin carboxylase